VRPESLTSLAILKVNWDHGHDYVENFVPFVIQAVNASAQPEISVAAIQAYVQENFGLKIPQAALNTLLHRVARRGHIHKQSGIYIRSDGKIDTDFDHAQADATRQQSALLGKLLEFSAKKHALNWSQEEAEEALLSFLQSACVPLLATAIDGREFTTPTQHLSGSHFVVSAFIAHLDQHDPAGFAFLETVMKGNMLATALFLPDISKAKKKFQDLSVYLDTRILLRSLGFEGEGAQAYCNEFLTLLYESNISLYCFDITVDEVRRILDAAQHALRNPKQVKGLFSVYEHFVSQGLHASDVELAIAGLERSLKRLRIHVKSIPAQIVEIGLDERRFEQILHDELPDQRTEAQTHDVGCLTAIHRLRKGRIKSEIENCGYVFVTTNNAVARASSKFFFEQYDQVTVPLCVNDHTIATLAWVKNPTLAANFSRNRLIAESYAALQPAPELWRRYLNEIDRLQRDGTISEGDYHLLRFSTVARNALVDTTLGRPDAFTQGTVPEILEAARAEARRDTEQALSVEEQRRTHAEAKAQAAENALIAKQKNLEDRIRAIGMSVGIGARRLANFALISIAPVGVYETLPASVPPLPEKFVELLGPFALTVVFALTIWSLYSGGSVRKVGRIIEVWASSTVQRIIFSILLGTKSH